MQHRLYSIIALAIVWIAATIGMVPAASADDPIRVGVFLDLSGIYADASHQQDNAIKLFMAMHGDEVAGKKVELIIRDSQSQPAVAKRLVQEMILRDDIDFLTGVLATPSAFAIADLVTEAKVPTVIMNGQGEGVPEKSPYFVRVSVTVPQSAIAIADWAIENGIKEAYTLVADYQTGHDAEKAFITAFTAKGGKIVESLRAPLRTHDYSPFLQKVKDAQPQALFAWVPVADQLVKGMDEQGIRDAGIKVLGTGEMTDDRRLYRTGNAALGIITAHNYANTHDSDVNRKFVAKYREMFDSEQIPVPGFIAVGAYDAMAIIYETIKKLDGKVEPEAAMKVLSSMKIESPRGPIQIDPATRDIVQNIYVRRVEKLKDEDRLANVEFETYPMVGDPWKGMENMEATKQ